MHRFVGHQAVVANGQHFQASLGYGDVCRTCSSVFLAGLLLLPKPGACEPETLEPSSVKAPVTEVIELEPSAAAFWSRLQDVLANDRSLEDFPGLVRMLGLKLTDPADAIDPLRPEPRWRTDIRDGRGGFIASGRFGVGRDTSPQRLWFRTLEIKLNLKSICISAQEVKRVFGPTREFPVMPTDIRDP